MTGRVLHTILFNTRLDEAGVRALFEQAQQQLGPIPGVRGFTFGQATGPGARYRYLLQVHFADAEVITQYRDHPVHQDFARRVFRPVAEDRLTTDFLLL
ncbi:hypothetical protein Mesil_3261 (plasmid) [Allomeiothermus silvanus DSM 9946]|uniref:Stress-response A/B barrel domain-containing protein n=1 Tax=Allomeiothermus silvanus (strain ATCC 700542 / DSM 9946 / NBRC 106475 / NCIMB 13440 / VI-R2) TaxID=526227 RepID=D7BIS1_ALLS1|nr:Dabb family protein [Allomeiothermus silvanus]ADH65077.1 hypothetical protein Mesil_3261 [Allomeiothermus silvanus DSM 9946]